MSRARQNARGGGRGPERRWGRGRVKRASRRCEHGALRGLSRGASRRRLHKVWPPVRVPALRGDAPREVPDMQAHRACARCLLPVRLPPARAQCGECCIFIVVHRGLARSGAPALRAKAASRASRFLKHTPTSCLLPSLRRAVMSPAGAGAVVT
eukprot:PRCOL_00000907-RA